MSLDGKILIFVQDNIRNDFLTPIMKFSSLMGDKGFLWIAIGLILLVVPKWRKAGISLIACLITASLISSVGLKNLFCRVRPYEVIEGLNILVKPESSFSFPSGHSCSSFAAATGVFLVLGGKSVWLYLPAALIAVSRVYVGVHYPSDALIGALIGAFLAWCTVKVMFRKIGI